MKIVCSLLWLLAGLCFRPPREVRSLHPSLSQFWYHTRAHCHHHQTIRDTLPLLAPALPDLGKTIFPPFRPSVISYEWRHGHRWTFSPGSPPWRLPSPANPNAERTGGKSRVSPPSGERQSRIYSRRLPPGESCTRTYAQRRHAGTCSHAGRHRSQGAYCQWRSAC